MTDIVPLKACGNCKHWQPGSFTPSGRPRIREAGQCGAVVVLGAIPMAYRVELTKSYVWFKNDASKCPSHEPK